MIVRTYYQWDTDEFKTVLAFRRAFRQVLDRMPMDWEDRKSKRYYRPHRKSYQAVTIKYRSFTKGDIREVSEFVNDYLLARMQEEERRMKTAAERRPLTRRRKALNAALNDMTTLFYSNYL